MKALLPLIALGISWTADAITPNIDYDNFYTTDVNNSDVPSGEQSQDIGSFCFEDNVNIRPNNDGTFDISFDEFNIETSPDYRQVHASCGVVIPIKVPEGKKVRFSQLGLEGETEVSLNGQSFLIVRPGYENSERRLTVNRYFHQPKVQDIVETTNIGEGYSECGDSEGNIQILMQADIIIAAHRANAETKETYMAIDGGAFRYFLDYQDCGGEPGHGDNPWMEGAYQFSYVAADGNIQYGSMSFDKFGGRYETFSGGKGTLQDVRYSNANKKVVGRWRFDNGQEGWFRFRTSDRSAQVFQGEWGVGRTVGSNRRGTWNGKR
ncbi:DUF4360 domain-containing protein [Pseudobacteriovorax antillogorgiicola]|uniref:MORN repeat-containing protein n=1 Tax=Pseudobacteriovorax antillogorgiicola TaxID=1513793 RepID=A0A1Y6BIX2_9BACT|nr:DUF4360 domain-containing protein [Pseudobacteriovorax antillogorgiicola]TCS56395.1 uncharacterized protein DUF4360 [Pseudobacteriovorax antillogorgiicola]SMF06147.1 protein of unknown function [Pseudobacteriovorax antillogorgiicola]